MNNHMLEERLRCTGSKTLPAWLALTFILLSAIFALILGSFSPALATAQETADNEANRPENPALTMTVASLETGTQDDTELPVSRIEDDYQWSIDANGKLTIAPLDGKTTGSITVTGGRRDWYSYCEQITSVKVVGTISVSTTDNRLWPAFSKCRNLVAVDLAGLDVSRLVDFSAMFEWCEKLTSADLSAWKAPSAQNVLSMFRNCYNLESVKLPDFSGSKLTTMSTMFTNCHKLAEVDLSTIDTSEVTSAITLFGDCRSLSKVIVGDKWDLYNHSGYGYDGILNGCFALVGAKGTSSDSVKVYDQTYARIDEAPENPGYFWPADNSGNPDSGDNGNQGDGNDESGNGNASDSESGSGTGDTGSSGTNASGSGTGTGAGTSTNNSNSALNSGTSVNAGVSNTSTSVNAGTSNTSTTANNKGNGSATGSNSAAKAQNKNVTAASSSKRTSITKATVKLSASSYAYNGKVRTPSVTVRLNGKTLKAGKDYVVTYAKGRKNVGTYKVTVAGKGSYTSRVTKSFRIVRKSLAKAKVTLSATTYAYSGKAQTPAVKVRLDGRTLKAGRDFAVKHPKGRTEIGTYKVTVAGKGSYSSKASKSFRIVPKTPTVISLKPHKNSDGTSGFIAAWSKSGDDAIGYQIRWSPAKRFNVAATCAFKGVSPYAKAAAAALQVKTRAWLGKTAYVQVRAFKTVGGKQYYSSWSSAKTVKLKK